MIGTNKLHFNKAEMMRAVEYYLNNVQFKEIVAVSDISENKSESTFIVYLEEVSQNQSASPEK